ncbi:unnamed protein product [Heligmosomoides polygyrus]|uniref:Resolvase/invertase-type recombinase catalytic domain-containing protein n=1 Tax=Heligmosomoides polygyrus TaxID=6339 RepID=A0A183F4K5_HELPZ|nr:unnamed protein product [Heligmosomoides polygyrus]
MNPAPGKPISISNFYLSTSASDEIELYEELSELIRSEKFFCKFVVGNFDDKTEMASTESGAYWMSR